jgi:hypothetical protein
MQETSQLDDIKFNVDSWKIRNIERSRGRMKIQVKLDKEQTEAFKSFSDTLKPPNVDNDHWFKMIFFMGIEAINEKMYKVAQEAAEEKAKDLEASGITIVEDDEGAFALSSVDEVVANLDVSATSVSDYTPTPIEEA